MTPKNFKIQPRMPKKTKAMITKKIIPIASIINKVFTFII